MEFGRQKSTGRDGKWGYRENRKLVCLQLNTSEFPWKCSKDIQPWTKINGVA